MATLAHTRASPEPRPKDCDFGTPHAAADQNARMNLWVGGLPTEIWLCVLDHLCPHCHAGPVLKPGFVFEESYDTDITPQPLPVESRRDLISMTMTCRGFRDLAQNYVFHCFDSSRRQEFSLFRRTVIHRPDLARGVKEMALSSALSHRTILRHLGNIRTLNFRVTDVEISEHQKDKPENKRFVGDLKNLRHLMLMPTYSSRTVDLAMARRWLERVIMAAPGLQSLRSYRLTDFPYSLHPGALKAPPQHTSPRLPENRVTKLEFLRPRLGFQPLKQLLHNFGNLQEFRLMRTTYIAFKDTEGKTIRSLDAQDVVTLLEPLRHQLEVLELDFCAFPKFESAPFRPISSLAGFSALKHIRMSRTSIGVLPGVDEDEHPEHVGIMSQEELDMFRGEKLPNPHAFFTERLPCKSLEFLQIHDFDERFGLAVIEFARHASRGGCPNLKHVRFCGTISCRLDSRYYKPKDLARYHNLKSVVPEESWDEALVVRAMYWGQSACEAERLFRDAGVLFERLEVKWPTQDGRDPRVNNGWMRVYPQPCVGGCGDPDCVVVHGMLEELTMSDSGFT